MVRENRDGLEKKAQREEEAGDVTQCGKSFLLADFNLTTSNGNLINASIQLVLMKLCDMSFLRQGIFRGLASYYVSRLHHVEKFNIFYFSLFALKVIDTNLVESLLPLLLSKMLHFHPPKIFLLFVVFLLHFRTLDRNRKWVYLRVIVFKLASYFFLCFIGYEVFACEYFTFS